MVVCSDRVAGKRTKDVLFEVHDHNWWQSADDLVHFFWGYVECSWSTR